MMPLASGYRHPEQGRRRLTPFANVCVPDFRLTASASDTLRFVRALKNDARNSASRDVHSATTFRLPSSGSWSALPS